MRFWLVKSEPDTYSLEDFEKEGTTSWTGVRNYAARNNIRAMEKGDRVFFYHSGPSPEVVGEGRVVSPAYPDAEIWTTIDIKFVRKLPHPVSRERLLQEKVFADSILKNRGRLSVQPLTPEEVKVIEKLSSKPV